LVALLAETYVAVHLRDTLSADGLSFHYTLAPGPATSRTAIALLDLHGAPRDLVARADARARSMRDHKARATGGVTS
jgi:DNA mismatch repair ATPase MutS